MSNQSSTMLKSVAAGLVLGGLAFAATKMMAKHKSFNIKKAAGKALKAAGSLVENMQF